MKNSSKTTTTTTNENLIDPKARKGRFIIDRQTTVKAPIEVKATLRSLNEDWTKVSDIINPKGDKGLYIDNLRKLGSNSKSNLKTRAYRCLYRSIESSATKDSTQAKKFSLVANYSGFAIQFKTPLLRSYYKANGDLNLADKEIKAIFENNEVRLKFTNTSKKPTLRREFKLTDTQAKKVDEFKKEIGNPKAESSTTKAVKS